MIAPLEVVQGMELTPQACCLCANNPVDEATGEQQPAIFAPGVDFNWGDSAYICWSCVGIIADLADRVPIEKYKKVLEAHKRLKDKYEALQEAHAESEAYLDRIRDGAAAAKQIRKAA